MVGKKKKKVLSMGRRSSPDRRRGRRGKRRGCGLNEEEEAPLMLGEVEMVVGKGHGREEELEAIS